MKFETNRKGLNELELDLKDESDCFKIEDGKAILKIPDRVMDEILVKYMELLDKQKELNDLEQA